MDTPTPEVETTAKKINPFLKVLMILFAVPTMIVYESAKSLCKKAYGAYDSFFPTLVGILMGLGTGIGSGYYLGWAHNMSVSRWLPGGLAAFALSFFYLWPIVYLAGVKKLFELSKTLWKAVDGSEHSQSWFTPLLMFLGYSAIVGGSAYLGWSVLTGVHDHLGWGWFGYVVGLAVGAVVGCGAGAVAWKILKEARLGAIVAVSGAGLCYLFAPVTGAMVASTGLPAGFAWGAYVLEFALWVAYLFPVLHVIMTHGFRWLHDLVQKLCEKVYDEEKGGYREFFLQVANIGSAVLLATLSLSRWASFGLTPISGYVLAGAVALSSYIVVGKLLDKLGSGLAGVAAALTAAWISGWAYYNHGLWFGYVGALAVGLVCAFTTFFVGFPALYLLVRLIAQPLLASWLRKPLVWLFENIYEGFRKVLSEVFHAFSNTYDDETPHRELFLQVTNLATAVGVAFGSLALANLLGFATWLTVVTMAFLVGLSYLLVGKLFLKAGNYLVGTLVSLATGIFAGVLVFAAFPLWVAILSGLVAWALSFFLAFPVAYVVVRGIANIMRASRWLGVFLSRIHTWCWARFTSLWTEFLEVYRGVRDWFKPWWKQFSQSWNDTWTSVKQTMSQFNSNRKK